MPGKGVLATPFSFSWRSLPKVGWVERSEPHHFWFIRELRESPTTTGTANRELFGQILVVGLAALHPPYLASPTIPNGLGWV